MRNGILKDNFFGILERKTYYYVVQKRIWWSFLTIYLLVIESLNLVVDLRTYQNGLVAQSNNKVRNKGDNLVFA